MRHPELERGATLTVEGIHEAESGTVNSVYAAELMASSSVGRAIG